MSSKTPLSLYSQRAYTALQEGKCLIAYKAPGGMTIYKQGARDRSGYFSPIPKSENFMKSIVDDLVARGLATTNTLGYFVLKK